MFGYLVAAQEELTEEQFQRYRACYCGLCRAIQDRHGTVARLSLTYDMTFLTLLLSSLYEPEELTGEGICLLHPRKPRAWWRSEFTDYAADMNVALAYLKCLDDWEDDSNPAALAESRLFKAGYEKAKEAWPRQCETIERALRELHRLEREKCSEPDAPADCFGELMGAIFVLRDDRWSESLYRLGFSLGRFLYVMDACMDLNADTLRGRFNPFRRYYGLPDNARRFEDILKMILGEALFHFDRLPLVQDAGLMQNILCSGLWTQFNSRYKKVTSDGTGPV